MLPVFIPGRVERGDFIAGAKFLHREIHFCSRKHAEQQSVERTPRVTGYRPDPVAICTLHVGGVSTPFRGAIHEEGIFARLSGAGMNIDRYQAFRKGEASRKIQLKTPGRLLPTLTAKAESLGIPLLPVADHPLQTGPPEAKCLRRRLPFCQRLWHPLEERNSRRGRGGIQQGVHPRVLLRRRRILLIGGQKIVVQVYVVLICKTKPRHSERVHGVDEGDGMVIGKFGHSLRQPLKLNCGACKSLHSVNPRGMNEDVPWRCGTEPADIDCEVAPAGACCI